MDRAKEAFLKYASQFDQSVQKVRIKIEHPFRVLALSYLLAEKLNLSKEDTRLINYIALLHDIGRFQQLEVIKSFQDNLFDHASYGVEYLFTEGHIHEFLDDETDYEIIKKAIYYHNKHVGDIPVFDERTNMFIKLIRDLDKTDILNTIVLEYDPFFKKKEVPDAYFEQFFKHESIKVIGDPNDSKNCMVTCAYVYDLNYPETKDIINEREYFKKYLDKVEVDENSKELFQKIKNNVEEALQKEN